MHLTKGRNHTSKEVGKNSSEDRIIKGWEKVAFF
jgi:hypothetical protein